MQKHRFLFCSFLLSFSFLTHAQFKVSGKVSDAESKEPLQGASVFCQNTTLGTITNKDGNFLFDVKPGGYDLIITYTGYQTKLVRINTNDSNSVDIEITKEDKSLGEVVVKSSNEVPNGWEKYGTFFNDHFIGSTPFAAQCSLQNPIALKFFFYKKSNKLKVFALEPLIITNNALGYTLNYKLDSFVYYYQTDLSSYRGFCLYSQMEGNEDQKKAWDINRTKAYFGSMLHFMRSYYDSTLQEDGFRVDILDENNDTKFQKVENPYDSSYYTSLDSTNEVEIFYPRKFSVTYVKRVPEKTYLLQYKLPTNIGVQISYIDMREAIIIKQNGYYYDQKDWVNQGYWSWKNLADQLPYDYNPD